MLGLGSNLSKSGVVTPGIVTDNLVYDAGAVVPGSDGAAFFDGTDDYIALSSVAYDIDGSDVSFAWWSKRTDTSTHNLVLAGHQNFSFINLHSNGNMYIESDTNDNLASAPITTDTNWHHYAIICSSGTVAMYEDGVSLTMGDSSISGDFTPTSIGFSTGKFFNGYICNMGIWTGTALSQARVKSIMNKNYAGLTTGTGSESENLVSWWNLDSKTEYDVVGTDGDLVLDETITLGNELITGFTNGSSYPYDTFTSSGRDISAAIETSGDWGGCASNSLNLTIGEWYKCTFNLQYNSGTDHIQMVFANGPSGASSHRSNNTFTSTNGENIMYFKVSATDSGAYLEIGIGEETDVINFSMTDISLKKITGNIGELL